MSRHEFTLIVDGPDLQDEATKEALYEAGCDDATVGRVGPIQYLDFDRESESFPDAVASAIGDIEGAVPGARVLHLEPDDLVTMSEMAERTGRTRESVRLLVSGERGPGGFPPPSTLISGPANGCGAGKGSYSGSRSTRGRSALSAIRARPNSSPL